MALDAYIWLAFRLHSLQNPTPIPWAMMYKQFGAGFSAIKHFQAEFKKSLALALAAYNQTRVGIEAQGIILHPSPPPIPDRIGCRLIL